VTLDETTDPSDEEYQDEYQRVLAVLYQAIEDIKQISSDARKAAGDAGNAARAAEGAAEQAIAISSAAANAAGAAAALATDKASAAQAAADAANEAMNQAKGAYPSLDARIDAIESGKQEKIDDLETIRSNSEKGATAVQPDDLSDVATSGKYEDLIGKPVRISDFENDIAVTFEECNNPSELVN
jgi:hypothetical protein